jgi:hypothetical protein
MISMGTIAELREQNHTLALFCVACNRWDTADLAGLVRRGYGSRSVVRTRFRCRDCGELAEKQLRPPVPDVTRAIPYIERLSR